MNRIKRYIFAVWMYLVQHLFGSNTALAADSGKAFSQSVTASIKKSLMDIWRIGDVASWKNFNGCNATERSDSEMNKSKTATAVSMLSAAVLILFSAPAFADQQTTSENKATSKDVKQETMEAIEAIKKYSIEKKDKAVREVKVVLEDLDTRIDRMQSRLENKWDEMDQASRESARKTIQTLRKKRNELSEWYGGMKHSSAEAWEHVKKGFVDGYEAVASAFDKADNELSTDESGKSGG